MAVVVVVVVVEEEEEDIMCHTRVCRGVDAGQKILRRDFISLLLWRLSGHPTQDTAYTHTRPRPACCAPRRVLLALRGRCDNTDI